MAGVAGAALLVDAASPARGADNKALYTPNQAFKWLEQGNRRWVSGHTRNVDHTPSHSDTTKGQWPFAAILSCSDSRVNPERVFDVQRANLFNVRNAGNIGTDGISIGSLEYAVAILKVALVVVLGHSGCGAVSATQNTLRTGEYPGGDIDDIVDAILPAIDDLGANQTLSEGIWANAAYSAGALRHSSMIRDAIDSGQLRVKHATYDLRSRRVTFA